MEPDREQLARTLERVEAMEALAERILAECRITLMMSFRFLDRALWKLPYVSLRFREVTPNMRITPRSALATDGHVLYYNAKAVINAFRINPDLVVRAYLHSLLHCVFRHPFHTVRADVGLWSLACDICVETIALEMCDGRFPLDSDEVIALQTPRIAELAGSITPANVYRALMLGKTGNVEADDMRLYAELNGSGDAFARDDHQVWDLVEPAKPDEQSNNPDNGSGSDTSESEPGDGSENEPDGADPSDAPEDSGNPMENDRTDKTNQPSDDAGNQRQPDHNESQLHQQHDVAPHMPHRQIQANAEPEYSESDSALRANEDDVDEEDWERIAKQIETELRTIEKERGEGAGSFVDNLALANRSRIDYANFLRRFATRAEDAQLNDEEFDYIFYTYGLKLYENMPLVEPLEYKETERIREFVIAIDTSGSCSHGLVQAFLTRTYEILSRSGSFDERVNVHIVQCDADVQSAVVIHNVADIAAYERGFEVHGYGGTDFRPVFAYVNELIAAHEFTDLRGLVYFTDGYGTFPTKAPTYDVAFVFVEEDGKDRRVPPWAMKVVLDEDALHEMM